MTSHYRRAGEPLTVRERRVDGAALKRWRLTCGYDPIKAARLAGMKSQAVWLRWESNQVRQRADTVAKVLHIIRPELWDEVAPFVEIPTVFALQQRSYLKRRLRN